jgi:ABC-type phosphate transport system substrate-binding protein
MTKIKAVLCLMLLLLVTGKTQASEHYKVIVHPDVEQESISANALRAIFSMRMKTWPNNRLVKVYVLPDDHPLHQMFSKETLNVFPYQLRANWDRLVFSGTGQAPTTVASYEEMLRRIANTPGSIGYLESSFISDDVYVLQIK